jgi:quinol monooxygenase YgiN
VAVAAEFHTRLDAIEAMKQVVAEVTAPSLGEEGCQIYGWSLFSTTTDNANIATESGSPCALMKS